MTDATGGIGRAIVSALVAAGYQVIVVGRDLDRLGSLGDVQPSPRTWQRPSKWPQRSNRLPIWMRWCTAPGVTGGRAGRRVRPASVVTWVLAAPADAYVAELSVLASPREG